MNLNINFIKSREFSFTYQCFEQECILNIMTTNSSDFIKSESIKSFINYMKTIRFDKVRVSWIGTVPDIELSDFVETLNITSKNPAPVPNEEPRYPTIFNPFEMIPSQTTSTQIKQFQTNPIKTNPIKIDFDTVKSHIKSFPAHPNLLDSSQKNKLKVQNYIKSVLGKQMSLEYLEQLTSDIMNYAKEHPNEI